MINIWGDEYANYSDLIIIHYIHVLPHYTILYKLYNFMCQLKLKEKRTTLEKQIIFILHVMN
jgi:hypothetical protein